MGVLVSKHPATKVLIKLTDKNRKFPKETPGFVIWNGPKKKEKDLWLWLGFID